MLTFDKLSESVEPRRVPNFDAVVHFDIAQRAGIARRAFLQTIKTQQTNEELANTAHVTENMLAGEEIFLVAAKAKERTVNK